MSRITGNPKEVNEAHRGSDVDTGTLAQHHTLGTKPFQAAPGNHGHYPAGIPFPWFVEEVPDGFFALGDTLSRTECPKLFELWGTTFGVGDGSTTFGTPDIRFRALLGAETAADAGTSDGDSTATRESDLGHGHSHGNGDLGTGDAGSHNHGGRTANTGHASGAVTGSGANTRVISIQGSTTSHDHVMPNEPAHSHGITGTTAAANTYSHPFMYCQWIAKKE